MMEAAAPPVKRTIRERIFRGLIRVLIVISLLWAVVVGILKWPEWPDEGRVTEQYRLDAAPVRNRLKELRLLRDDELREVRSLDTEIRESAEQLDEAVQTANGYVVELRARIVAARAALEAIERQGDDTQEMRAARARAERATKQFHANPNALTIADETEAHAALREVRSKASKRIGEAQKNIESLGNGVLKYTAFLKDTDVLRSQLSGAASTARATKAQLPKSQLAWMGGTFLLWLLPVGGMFALFGVGCWVVRGFTS